MPTREEAVQTLYELINSGILSDELVDKLEDIAKCIEAECEKNIFLWGAQEIDWMELFIARREDLWTEEEVAKCKAIYEKYKVTDVKGEDEDEDE